MDVGELAKRNGPGEEQAKQGTGGSGGVLEGKVERLNKRGG